MKSRNTIWIQVSQLIYKGCLIRFNTKFKIHFDINLNNAEFLLVKSRNECILSLVIK